ncbi:MAG: hypothetical protein K0Q73_2424 [Paenibacillus sp.]|jgi:hypothetical protein|nr:hypothetical protein [Paenibacillus sp.]
MNILVLLYEQSCKGEPLAAPIYLDIETVLATPSDLNTVHGANYSNKSLPTLFGVIRSTAKEQYKKAYNPTSMLR